jgi:2-polyprenyl-3-methyl-5-hydroxy-6-metoxy-1,4-benzoquinol methylase
MSTVAPVSPDVIFDTLFAYQQTAALKAAIDLEVFTAIDEGARTPPAIAARTKATERGIRILCDFLTTIDLVEKSDGLYGLTPTSAAFLSKRSQMYLGTMANFLTLPELRRNFDGLTETIRTGSLPPAGDTVSTENPIWLEFARAMVPMAVPAAHAIAAVLGIDAMGPARVLDIAAGHGMYGIVLAQRNPAVEVSAADWAPVLGVAQEHARQAGVESRFHQIPGDAFQTDFGTGYDLALITNFLHHFDEAQCTVLLKKVKGALAPSGRVAIVEFVPNDDRVTPAVPARFSLTMLAGTRTGDAYTLAQHTSMLENAGFSGIDAHQLPTPQQVIVAHA